MVKQTKKERNRNKHLAKIKAKEKKEKRKKSLQYLQTFRDTKRVFSNEICYNILKKEFPDVNVFSKRRKSKEEKKMLKKTTLVKSNIMKNNNISKLRKIKEEVEKERHDLISKELKKNKNNPCLLKGEMPAFYGYDDIRIMNECYIICSIYNNKERYAECVVNKMKNSGIRSNNQKEFVKQKKDIEFSSKKIKKNKQNQNFNEETNIAKKNLSKNKIAKKRERYEKFKKERERYEAFKKEKGINLPPSTPDFSEDSFEKQSKLSEEIDQYQSSGTESQGESNFQIREKTEKEYDNKNKENNSENEEISNKIESSSSENEESSNEIESSSSENEESINEIESSSEEEESSIYLYAEKGQIPPPINKKN